MASFAEKIVCATISKAFGKFMKACQIDELLIHIKNASSENESYDSTNPTEKNTEFFQDETTVKPNTNPTDKTKQNPLQNPESSYTEKFTGQRPNPSVELQQKFSEDFASDHTQTEKQRLRLPHQQRMKLQIIYYEKKIWNLII